MAILCNLSVDYSNDSSNDRILPFKFTLTDDSVLSPEEGEFQKFCYDVEATGTDNSDFADLSHFILGYVLILLRQISIPLRLRLTEFPRQ